MKRLLSLLLTLLLCFTLSACNVEESGIYIAATTLPVYEFTFRICEGTDIRVSRLVTEEVSCLHDYTLQVKQMRVLEQADMIVISGAGLEDFLEDALKPAKKIIDASTGIELLCPEDFHDHEHDHDGHNHTQDPHIWLSPTNAKNMAANIYAELVAKYPQYSKVFASNFNALNEQFEKMNDYAKSSLSELTRRELITFHDGFAYMADAFDLTILHTIEEESGSEASAAELIELIQIVTDHNVKAIFVEKNSSGSAASVISAETNTPIYSLDMAMSGDSYFTAMYHNIDTLKEALQ